MGSKSLWPRLFSCRVEGGMAVRPGRANPLDLGLALGGEAVLEEPLARPHPVAWMGRAIDAAEERAPPNGRADRLLYGLGVAMGLPAAVWASGPRRVVVCGNERMNHEP